MAIATKNRLGINHRYH